MRRDDEGLLVLLVLAGLAFLRRRVTWPQGGWMWPVPTMKAKDGAVYQAVISDGVGTARPGGQVHRGVDVLYKRRNGKDRPEYKAGTSDGTPGFFAPPLTPILAARDGVLWSSAKTARGGTVVIDHGKPWATYYTHMERLAFPEHANGRMVNTADATEPGAVTHVKAGDVIGFMGFDPMDAGKLRHLHFAVWHGGTDGNAIDPEHEMISWPRPSWQWTPNR